MQAPPCFGADAPALQAAFLSPDGMRARGKIALSLSVVKLLSLSSKNCSLSMQAPSTFGADAPALQAAFLSLAGTHARGKLLSLSLVKLLSL